MSPQNDKSVEERRLQTHKSLKKLSTVVFSSLLVEAEAVYKIAASTSLIETIHLIDQYEIKVTSNHPTTVLGVPEIVNRFC